MRHSIDPLRTARGILIGLALCVPVWFVIAAFADGIRQSDLIEKRAQETTLGSSFRSADGGR